MSKRRFLRRHRADHLALKINARRALDAFAQIPLTASIVAKRCRQLFFGEGYARRQIGTDAELQRPSIVSPKKEALGKRFSEVRNHIDDRRHFSLLAQPVNVAQVVLHLFLTCSFTNGVTDFKSVREWFEPSVKCLNFSSPLGNTPTSSRP